MNFSKYEALWNDEALVERIDAGIERHRKTDVTLRVADSACKPVAGAPVKIKQITSDFLFGANIFKLGCYADPALERGYEGMFTRLLNAASVPLYWKTLEPRPGAVRFEVNSEPIDRRPPPDLVVPFCQQHNLNMNGHCLVWDNTQHAVPEWIEDTRRCEPLIENRIRQIAERYGDRIQRWDVLNESLARGHAGKQPIFPDGYEWLAFECAQRYLPDSAHLMINETTGAAWHPKYLPDYHKQIEAMLKRGVKIDGIGLQWHLFTVEDVRRMFNGERFQPKVLLDTLDSYNVHGRPLHISEITLPCPTEDKEGRDIQARMAYDVYRLFFSQKMVHAVTWWNFPDGGAVPGEDRVLSGLVERDMSPKPAYESLDQLINHDWRTNTIVTTGADGIARFRGFRGEYRITCGGTINEMAVTGEQVEQRVIIQ
ncbi:MAG: endo-1,4-beta-xylanase [Phycisphaeraceae bacterium]